MGRWHDGVKYGRDGRPQQGFASGEQKARNAAAAAEGRAVYMRGIPPDWSKDHLEEFLAKQGQVEGMNFMPLKAGQNARAAFVNFASAEDASAMAEVCDNLSVESMNGDPGKHRLVCSLKQAPGKKVDMVSGFSDLSKARQEKRSVYMSGLGLDFDTHRIKALLSSFGTVESVKDLPVSRNKACFAIMSLPEEALRVIENLDGQTVEGKRISVTFPRPPKRTRGNEEDDNVVEIQGFPYDSLPTEVSAAIEAGGREVSSVKMLRHQSMNGKSIALVFMQSKEDATAVVRELDGFEYMPGCILAAKSRSRPKDEMEPPAMEPPPTNPALAYSVAPGTQWGLQAAPVGQQLELRIKGRVVGRLRRDGPRVSHPTPEQAAAIAMASGEVWGQPPAKRARHAWDGDEQQTAVAQATAQATAQAAAAMDLSAWMQQGLGQGWSGASW